MPPAARCWCRASRCCRRRSPRRRRWSGTTRGVGAEEHRAVDQAGGGLLAERLDLVPDRRVGVVEDVLRDRDDHGELLDVEELVRPVDLGRLLEAGVAGDPVRDRQGGQDREADLRAADRHAPEQLAGALPSARSERLVSISLLTSSGMRPPRRCGEMMLS
jgi:hypothetical protein